jgi:alpha-tubulin suppressor-like RCC1 family protein
VPADVVDVRAIAGGGAHAIALLGDGRVRSWGRCSEDQCTEPAGLGRVASIAGASYLTIAIDSSACAADVTGNGVVDGEDLATLLSNWGPCGG